MNLNLYSIFPFCSAILVMSVGIIAYCKSKNSKVSINFFLFCLAIFVWLFSYSIAFSCVNKDAADIWLKIGFTGVIFIPAAIFSFTFSLLQNKNSRYVCIVAYFISLVFTLFGWFSKLLVNGYWTFSWGTYPKASYIHPLLVLYMCASFSVSIILLFFNAYLVRSKSVNFERFKYVAWSLSFGVFGSIDFIANYGLHVYPFGWLFVDIYISIIAYTIIKYRLMDTSVIFTRTGIFIAVYSLVLGIPFALAFGGREKLLEMIGPMWWMVPLVTSTVLATVGPFIYVFVQRRAEDRLFQEQRRYQATLRQASTGMGKIKDLKRLVTMIVHIMTRTVRVEFSMVFLNDVYAKKFRLGAFRSRQARSKFRSDVDETTALVQYLKETQNPIVYDEIKQRTQDYGDLKLARLEAELKAMDAALVVPSFIDEKLVAILVMGNKISGKTYSSDDLAVFSILANQSALAIENAQFYDEMKSTHAQLLKAEKMATIGTLADGLSHQINNRLHAMGFIAGDALDTLKLGHNLQMSLEVKEMVLDLEHAFNRIESNVQQGGEIVQGLLKYTRKDDASVKDIGLDQLIAAALDMTQFKIKPGEIAISHEYPSDLPKIHGNFTQLQEVFFNLIDNAYDAMMQRRTELQENAYAPTIRIKASGGSNGHLTIIVEDNGIGIQEQDKEKIFTPFFTTKLSSKKGTGLGLYVIQRLIEENHKGKVVYESKYQQGTTVYLTLPAA